VQRFLQLALLGASLLGFSVWLVIAACGAWSPGQRLGTCAGFVLGVPAVVFILAPEMPVVEPIIVEYSRSHGMDWRRQEALEALFRKSGRSFEGLRAAAAKAGYVEFDGPGGFTLRKGENGPELVEYDYFTLREWGAPTIGGN